MGPHPMPQKLKRFLTTSCWPVPVANHALVSTHEAVVEVIDPDPGSLREPTHDHCIGGIEIHFNPFWSCTGQFSALGFTLTGSWATSRLFCIYMGFPLQD